jgi:hypothetical protein
MPTTKSDAIRLTRSIMMLALAGVVLACSTGCYERVTRARGFGADQYNVSEPYYEGSRIDDWIYGEKSTGTNRGSLLNR